jgi:CRP/FNR family cyclic AMP-dependent transcriptional regulator
MAEKKKSQGTRVRFYKDDYLTRENDSSRELYIIKYGRVKIFKTEGGKKVELDVVGPGGIIGEVAAIDGGIRSASSIALETTEATVIDAAQFQAVMDTIPEWFRKIAKILVQRLREVDGRIHNTLDGDDLTHVAAVIALMLYAPKCQTSNSGYELQSKSVQDELVDLLHLQVADTDLALTALQKQGLLTVGRGKITIPDRRALEAFGDQTFHPGDRAPGI